MGTWFALESLPVAYPSHKLHVYNQFRLPLRSGLIFKKLLPSSLLCNLNLIQHQAKMKSQVGCMKAV